MRLRYRLSSITYKLCLPMKLTIAIPTFDRYEALKHTLKIIVPQLCEGVELVVLDNASPRPVEPLVLDLARQHDVEHCVRPIRNPYNIGANANILRCFEVAQGEWVWVLGDDDSPKANAVSLILSALAQNPECCYINFSSQIFSYDKDLTYSEAKEGLGAISFGNFLFISAGVYHIKSLRSHMRTGFEMIYSCGPHVVLVLAAMFKDGCKVAVSRAFIVDWTPSDQSSWNPLRPNMRLFSMVEAEFLPDSAKFTLAKKIDEAFTGSSMYIYYGLMVNQGAIDGSYTRLCGVSILSDMRLKQRRYRSEPLLKKVYYYLGSLASRSALASRLIVFLARCVLRRDVLKQMRSVKSFEHRT